MYLSLQETDVESLPQLAPTKRKDNIAALTNYGVEFPPVWQGVYTLVLALEKFKAATTQAEMLAVLDMVDPEGELSGKGFSMESPRLAEVEVELCEKGKWLLAFLSRDALLPLIHRGAQASETALKWSRLARARFMCGRAAPRIVQRGGKHFTLHHRAA